MSLGNLFFAIIALAVLLAVSFGLTVAAVEVWNRVVRGKLK